MKGDKTHLSGDGPADYDLLASRLLSEMRLEEKLAQMYGERRFMGFDKVFIPAGENKTVHFLISPSGLAWYNSDSGKREIEQIMYSVYVGGSSDTVRLLKTHFELQ